MKCRELDPILAPYVDGELAAADERTVNEHLQRCPPCHSRVDAERAVRELLHERRVSLTSEGAPASLRARCAAMQTARGEVNVSRFRVFEPRSWSLAGARKRAAPLAFAASLALLVSGAFLYQATENSTRVLAAELTADHVKCFGLNAALGTHEAPAAVEQSMLGGFGWTTHLPEQLQRVGLELVGSRPCLYAGGKVAHLMYRHEGHPVSVFMLPRVVRAEELVEVLGHQAAVWSAGGRTFVLIAREPRAEVKRMASIVQAALR